MMIILDPERSEACETLASAVCDLNMRILDDSFANNAAVHILLKNLIRHDKTLDKEEGESTFFSLVN